MAARYIKYLRPVMFYVEGLLMLNEDRLLFSNFFVLYVSDRTTLEITTPVTLIQIYKISLATASLFIRAMINGNLPRTERAAHLV